MNPSANFTLVDSNNLLAFGGKSSRETWLVHIASSMKRAKSVCLDAVTNSIVHAYKGSNTFVYSFGGESAGAPS